MRDERPGVAEDVDRALSDLELRLRELEAELAGEPPAPREPAADALDAFGASLRRTAQDLVASYDRALADARGLPADEALLFRDEVALDVAVDLDGLCSLAAALGRIGGVASVALRAYAGGHAAIDLVLDGAGVPLVTDLRRALDVPLAVVEARHGRLTLAVGEH